MYDPSYYQSSSSYPIDAEAAAGGILAMGATVLIVGFIAMVGAYILGCFLLSRIFKKAGVKTSIAYIPIYNAWKLLEIGGQKGFWIFVPVANTIFTIIAAYNIGKKLGKEDWFVILYIFVPLVWIIILGFDKSQWDSGNTQGAIDMNMGGAPAPQPVVPVQPDYSQPMVTPAPVEPQPVNFSQPQPMAQPEMTAPVETAPQPEMTAPVETPIVETVAEAPVDNQDIV